MTMGKQYCVIHPAFQPQGLLYRPIQTGFAEQAAKHNGIRRGEPRSQNERRSRRQSEQPTREEGDDKCRKQRTRTKHKKRKFLMLTHLSQVERNCICKQDKHETQSADDAQNWRMQIDIDQPEPIRTDSSPKRKKHGHLRKPASFDEA